MGWKHPLLMTIAAALSGCCPAPDDYCAWGSSLGTEDGINDGMACAEFGTTTLTDDPPGPSNPSGVEVTTCYQQAYEEAYDLFWEAYCE